MQPLRVVGVIEEYLYPQTTDLYFYRHATTAACYFEKPAKLKALDELAFKEQQQILQFGATLRQVRLAVKLQALVRGYQVRSYARYVERAMEISVNAESRYLANPLKDVNLFNYTLHCYVMQQDFARSSSPSLPPSPSHSPHPHFVLPGRACSLWSVSSE